MLGIYYIYTSSRFNSYSIKLVTLKLYNYSFLEKVRKWEERVYIISLVTWLTYIQSRIGFKERSWQNLVDLAEYSRMRQIAIRLPLDCHRLPADCYFAVSLFLLRRQKQVDVCKVLRRCPIIKIYYKERNYLGRDYSPLNI